MQQFFNFKHPQRVKATIFRIVFIWLVLIINLYTPPRNYGGHGFMVISVQLFWVIPIVVADFLFSQLASKITKNPFGNALLVLLIMMLILAIAILLAGGKFVSMKISPFYNDWLLGILANFAFSLGHALFQNLRKS